MLRTELPFRPTSWPLRVLALLLSEAFLGFLAIIAVALTLFPMLFRLSVTTVGALNAAQWAIIGWFGVEYVVALASAKSKRLFLRDPWRWIDLATVVVPLLSLLPSVSDVLRSSPVLRLIRLARVLSFGVRATGIVVRERPKVPIAAIETGPIRIKRRSPGKPAEVVTRDALLHWLSGGGPGWFHVASPDPDDLADIGKAAGLPEGFLETHLIAATHPHVAVAGSALALFVWAPERVLTDGSIKRQPLLMLFWENRVLSFSRTAVDAFDAADPTQQDPELLKAPLPARAVTLLLQRIIGDNETVIAGFEQQLRQLEDMSVRESRAPFFEQTFRLKKHLSAAQWDLWRLKAVLSQLGDQRSRVAGMSDAASFARYTTRIDYLYETVVNTREDVLAVIDLHLNVVSFDMNRVMRVLAVVSCLGLIPAVIGGLFGMNLIDNPWHFTLPQVSFVVVFGMVLGLYFFFVKGWLR